MTSLPVVALLFTVVPAPEVIFRTSYRRGARRASRDSATGKDHSKRASELLASARYGKYLRQLAVGQLRIDRGATQEAEHYDGKWVITSKNDTITAEDLALGYKQFLRVGQCWHQMKSGLRTRPVFHYRPWRIQAHVSLSVLALLLQRVAEIRIGDRPSIVRHSGRFQRALQSSRLATRSRPTDVANSRSSPARGRTTLSIPAVRLLQAPVRGCRL
jgi:hypothetical protein